VVSHDYDKGGNLKKITSSAPETYLTARTYDSLGRLTVDVGPMGGDVWVLSPQPALVDEHRDGDQCHRGRPNSLRTGKGAALVGAPVLSRTSQSTLRIRYGRDGNLPSRRRPFAIPSTGSVLVPTRTSLDMGRKGKIIP